MCSRGLRVGVGGLVSIRHMSLYLWHACLSGRGQAHSQRLDHRRLNTVFVTSVAYIDILRQGAKDPVLESRQPQRKRIHKCRYDTYCHVAPCHSRGVVAPSLQAPHLLKQ